MRLVLSLSLFILSLNAQASYQCVDLFNEVSSTYDYNGANNPTLVYKTPAFENFVRLYQKQLSFMEKMPVEMQETGLAGWALRAADYYEPALPYVIEIFRQLYNPAMPENSINSLQSYYGALARKGLVGMSLIRLFQYGKNDAMEVANLVNQNDPMVQKIIIDSIN